jgi:hypothetical protein
MCMMCFRMIETNGFLMRNKAFLLLGPDEISAECYEMRSA